MHQARNATQIQIVTITELHSRYSLIDLSHRMNLILIILA